MSEKTEQPTAQKIRKSREEGDVAKSKDLTQTVLILSLFGYVIFDSERLFKSFSSLLIAPVGTIGFEFDNAVSIVMTQLTQAAIAIILPFVLIVLVLGIFIEAVQTGMLISFKALKPSAKKLNFISNVKNMVSVKNLVEFLKNTVKILFLSALIYLVVKDAIPTLVTLPGAGIIGVGVSITSLLKVMITNIAIAYIAISLADFAWQRYQHTKKLMMSKSEVKQEYKQMEGDPLIKNKRKQLHQEMLADGAVKSASQATVLVTNPTHYAIALLYSKESTSLPIVTGKGEGAVAERMIEAARAAGVPVLQNIPLAHALIEQAELDQFIPSELINPVAEILRVVLEMNGTEE